MSDWRAFSKSQDEEPQTKVGFELSFMQLPNQPIVSLGLAPPDDCGQEEVAPSQLPKQPRIEQ